MLLINGLVFNIKKRLGSLLFSLTLLYCLPSWALELDQNIKFKILGPYLEHIASEDFDIQSYLKGDHRDGKYIWEKQERDIPSFGLDETPYWFRTQLKNTSSTELHLLLEIAYPILDNLIIYLIDDQDTVTEYQTGDKQPFDTRKINHRNFLYDFKLLPNRNYELIMRVQTSGAVQLPATLWEPQTFWTKDQHFIAGQGMYYGIMLVMVIYNLFLFFSVRDKNYLYYILTVLSYTIFQAAIHGFAYQYLWPNANNLNDKLLAVSVLSCGLIGSIFTYSFLQLNVHMRKCYYFLCGIAGFSALSLLAVWIIPYKYALKLAIIPVLPSCAIAFYAGFYLWLKGYSHAKFFFLAWFSLLIATAIFYLNKLGIVPRIFITEYAAQFGAVLEVVLLSFALGDRINQERKARELAQQEALTNEKKARIEQEKADAIRLKAKEDELSARKEIIATKVESEAKSRFLATMSHEIRTPMNGVLGMTQLLMDEDLNAKHKRYVEIINNSGKALLNIINDILDYSKIAAGKMEIEKVDFELEKLIDECTSVFTLTAENKDIEFIAYITPEVPTMLRGDPTRIRQIILNLVGNAFKFTNQGAIHLIVDIDLRYLGQSEQSTHIRFLVKDTGIGISRSGISDLFAPFKQADSSTTRKYGGTGLGLSISKQLVELMDGEISVDSIEGEGSTFWISIPFENATASEREQIGENYKILDNKRLLVVDDSPEFCLIMQEFAKTININVEVAYYGKQALETLKTAVENNKPFDFISIDLQMPGMTGIQLSQAIQEDKGLKDIPRLLLTAVKNCPNQDELDSAGISLAMQKPATIHTIREALLSLCHSSKVLEQSTSGSKPTEAVNSLEILVAEDNHVNTLVIKGMLEKLDLQADYTSDGAEAVETVKNSNKSYDLILMDCEMPNKDGYTASKEIREFEKDNNRQRTTIIALTAHALDQHIQKAVSAGMDGHLPKPIDLENLRELVSELKTN